MNNDHTNEGAENGGSQNDFQDEPMMPLGVGGFEQDGAEPFGAIEEQKKSRFSSGTIVLGAVVLLAIVGLYSMRSLAIARAGDSTDATLESTIEAFLSSLSGESDARNESVILSAGEDAGSMLVDDRTSRQVPLDNVQKNPFIAFAGPKTDESETEQPVDTSEAELAKARAEAKEITERAAEMLRVLMIMGGSQPMANISGRIVHPGDTVLVERHNVTFVVIEIGQGTVTLVAEDPAIGFRHEIVLRLHRNQ